MALHLYYKEGKLTRWRKVPIDFRNRDEAEEYYNKYYKGSKHKILFEEEEADIAMKKEKRKRMLVKTGKTVQKGLSVAGKNVAKGAKATHERLKVAGPRHMEEIRRDLGEPRHKPITAYDTTLREIREDKRKKERELTDKDLRRLAQEREKEKERRRAVAETKRKEWKPPPSPFGEFKMNLSPPSGAFEDFGQQAKKYEKGGPGFKVPFEEVHFNPNVNPFGIEYKKKKRR